MPVRRGTGWLIAAAIGVLLYFAQAAFIPVALALLFALVLSIPVEALHGKGLPRALSATLILIAFLALCAGAVNLLWAPATKWLVSAPSTLQTIERKLGPAARVIRRVNTVVDRATHLTDGATPSARAPTVAAPPPVTLWSETPAVLVSIVTVAILTLFGLAGGAPMLARMTTALASDAQATRVLKIIGAVRGELSRYYVTLAMINIGLGIATGLVMMLFGMPNPVLWGTLAALLNFIPYAGSATTLLVLTIVAFVSFDSVGPAVGVALSYLGLATIEGQIVQPLLVGHRLELNPIIVFLALWFGGWYWGIAGIVMAIPLLIALKVVGQHSEGGTALVEFLSPSRRRLVKPEAAQSEVETGG